MLHAFFFSDITCRNGKYRGQTERRETPTEHPAQTRDAVELEKIFPRVSTRSKDHAQAGFWCVCAWGPQPQVPTCLVCRLRRSGALRLDRQTALQSFLQLRYLLQVAFRSSASQGKGCSAVGATPSASLRLASCASMAERAAAYQLCNLADTGRLTTNSSLPTLACSAFSSEAFKEDSACAKDPTAWQRSWQSCDSACESSWLQQLLAWRPASP